MENTYTEKHGSYGKRPLWQWIALYAVAAVIVYGAVYYFFFSNNNGYSAPQGQQAQQY